MRRSVLLACLLVFAPGAAQADRESELERLRDAIQDARERVATYEREERGLLEAMEALDRTAVLLAEEVAAARGAATRARTERDALETRADELETRVDRSRRMLRSRARALYRAGELGSVRVLFASNDLTDFLSRVSSLRRLLEHDGELLARHQSELAALESARREARASAERLAKAESELATRSGELAKERSAKRDLVRRLHRDRKRERSALVELEKAAQALEETLASLGAETPSVPSGAGTSFAAKRGALAAPVKGRVIERFGKQVDREFQTETFRSGIVYDAKRGTPVNAVAPGNVRFAGWFRGYGRMVILDHGGQYYTVSGHLDELDVAVGDVVEARDRIGRVGETGSLAGPRLYFEVRQGAKPLDPGDWLQ